MDKIITERKWINSFDNTPLFFAKDKPKNCKAIIILLHGFTEHLGRYERLKNKLNQYGYAVYRYDYRGHGRSGGKRGHIKDYIYFFKDTDIIVDEVKRENINIPIFMFGFSMGGFIALSYGIKYKNKLNGQILSAPATMQPEILKGPLGTIIKVIYLLHPNFMITSKLWRMFMRNDKIAMDSNKDRLLLNQATLKLFVEFLIKGMNWLDSNIEMYNIPCLIIHGRDDNIILKDASEVLYKSISSMDKELKIYENLSHELFNEKLEENILMDINKWIYKRTKINNRVSMQ